MMQGDARIPYRPPFSGLLELTVQAEDAAVPLLVRLLSRVALTCLEISVQGADSTFPAIALLPYLRRLDLSVTQCDATEADLLQLGTLTQLRLLILWGLNHTNRERVFEHFISRLAGSSPARFPLPVTRSAASAPRHRWRGLPETQRSLCSGASTISTFLLAQGMNVRFIPELETSSIRSLGLAEDAVSL